MSECGRPPGPILTSIAYLPAGATSALLDAERLGPNSFAEFMFENCSAFFFTADTLENTLAVVTIGLPGDPLCA